VLTGEALEVPVEEDGFDEWKLVAGPETFYL